MAVEGHQQLACKMCHRATRSRVLDSLESSSVPAGRRDLHPQGRSLRRRGLFQTDAGVGDAGTSMPNSDPLEHPRVTLPKNLSETLKRLEDAELETLLREVNAEAERRGVMKPVRRYQRRKLCQSLRSRRGRARFGRAGRPSSGKGKPYQGLLLGRHEASSNCPHVPPLAFGREPGPGPAGEVKKVSGVRYDWPREPSHTLRLASGSGGGD
jgi:hypothetical protein